MLKKIAYLILIMLMPLLLVSGCGRGETNTKPTGNPKYRLYAYLDGNVCYIELFNLNKVDFQYNTELIELRNKGLTAVSSLNNLKYEGCNEPKISIYNTAGKFIKEIKLDLPYCNKIVINKNGIAYISHNNGGDSGDTITVFDTNTDKVVGQIKGFSGPAGTAIKDNYLFVSNYNTGKISVVDLRSNQIIGDIKLGEDVNPSKLVVF